MGFYPADQQGSLQGGGGGQYGWKNVVGGVPLTDSEGLRVRVQVVGLGFRV